MNALLDHISQHLSAYVTGAEILFVATVSSMPAKLPKSIDEVWTWIRESLQTAIPAARRANINPTHPENPDPK